MDAMPLKRLKEGFNIDNIMIMNPSLSLPVQAISIDYDQVKPYCPAPPPYLHFNFIKKTTNKKS